MFLTYQLFIAPQLRNGSSDCRASKTITTTKDSTFWITAYMYLKLHLLSHMVPFQNLITYDCILSIIIARLVELQNTTFHRSAANILKAFFKHITNYTSANTVDPSTVTTLENKQIYVHRRMNVSTGLR